MIEALKGNGEVLNDNEKALKINTILFKGNKEALKGDVKAYRETPRRQE